MKSTKLSRDNKIAIRRIIDDLIEHSAHLIGDLEALRLLHPDYWDNQEMQGFRQKVQQVPLPPYGLAILRQLSEQLTEEIEEIEEPEIPF